MEDNRTINFNENIIFKGITLGDEYSFKIFFERYFKRFCAFALKILEDNEESEEVVAETMAEIWERRKKFKSFKAIKTYAYSTIKNKALNIIKHQKAVRRHAEYAKYAEGGIFFENAVIEEEVCAMLYNSIADLPKECRRVFVLSEIEGLKLREIAEDLGVSMNTVKTHKLRATKFLREKLGKTLIIFLILLLYSQLVMIFL